VSSYFITIRLDAEEPEVLADVIKTLETVLPYMTDNVVVTSREVAHGIPPYMATCHDSESGQHEANEARFADRLCIWCMEVEVPPETT
jgi:hypothetical protein